MSTYGTFRYHNQRYGAYPPPVEQGIVGGPAPWLPGHTIPWRTAQPQVWTLDPETFAPVQQLPGLGLGCTRSAQLENDRYQAETLTLVLKDAAAYLPGGPYTALLAFNAFLRVFWTVASPAGVYSSQSPVYSVQSAPSRDDDPAGGGPLTCIATDWETVKRRIPYADQGFIDATINPPGLFPAFGEHWFDNFFWPPDQGPIPVTVPGTVAHWTDVLDFLWPWHPFRLVYDGQGASVVREGLTSYASSPWVLSTSAAVAGPLAIPWERLTRAVADAAFTQEEYHWVYELSGEAITPGGTIPSDAVGIATSASSVNPHRVTPPPQIQRTFDRTPYHAAGNVSAPVLLGLSRYAAYLLGQELGQRDTVTLEVDSACPAPELGVAIRIYDPPRVDGLYQLTAVSQPFDEGPATWTLGWIRDGD